MNNIKDIYSCEDTGGISIPFFSAMVRAGFPTLGESNLEEKVDLNKLLIKNPEATFFVIAEGHLMNYAGIHDGDLLIVDRSLEPVTGNIVISTANEELTIVPLSRKIQKAEVWGVVAHVIHKL